LGAPNQNRVNSAINLTLGAGALPYIFMTPPESVPGNEIAKYIFALDLDRAASRVTETSGDYAMSSMAFMTPPTHDLAAFRKSNGKLLMYHGAADPVFSLNDTIDAYGPALRSGEQFARLFIVPGMNHCGGGPATDMFDTLTPIVNWVEKGQAPDQIVGTANPNSPWPGRTRPLCPFPKQARYKGTGDVNDAASFSCVAP
jgi:feruloyl esterase